ncbi:hypothetical protein NUW54_g6991 [Trametes sanguinea]|uniref:Uncharacterized protein n=1 Tax=Trametes sanguinea TaxID=158606 RepID=A0ACC1PTI5_9APHY|nr:hypothetical protein NUW54_g6991 [Trametes sanguinea]
MPVFSRCVDDDSDLEYEDEIEDLGLLAAALLAGVAEHQTQRSEARNPTRRYLRRPQLLSNPRRNTPWQVLYESRDDRAYITTMGVDCATFDYVLLNGFAQRWNSVSIPRTDTNPTGMPRLGRRSLTAADTALQQIFALVPSTISRYRIFALQTLRDTLRELPEARVAWWSAAECEEDANLVMVRHPLLAGAIGGIDGMNIAMAESADPEVENSTYNGWLHGHYTSCVLVFSSKGTVS